MRCPICGMVMVERPPEFEYASYPPQWDKVLWCACGYQKNCGRVRGRSDAEILKERWDKANGRQS